MVFCKLSSGRDAGCVTGQIKDYLAWGNKEGENAFIKGTDKLKKPLWRPGGSWQNRNYQSAPYVRVVFMSNEGAEVTVGNNSFRVGAVQKNTAVIKSFEYSMSNGNQCKIEVVDEEGGAFNRFFSEVMKCSADSDKFRMKVDWGWVFRDCDNNTHVWRLGCDNEGRQGKVQNKCSCPMQLTFLLINVEVSYSGGKIRYMCTGVDMMTPVFGAREISGYSGTLKNAIEKLFGEDPPIDVKYYKLGADGKIDTWKFSDKIQVNGINISGDGPTSEKWPSDNQNRLATAMRWLQEVETENGKGITATWDSRSGCTGGNHPRGQIIFWEDFLPRCKEDTELSERNIGTFIVNGGRCSSVIEFTPKINWVQGFGQLGVGGGFNVGVDAETKSTKRITACGDGDTKQYVKNQGITMEWTAGDMAYNNLSEVLRRILGNRKANSAWEGIKPITAELRIVGNPASAFVDTTKMVGRTCTIIVINPFHLRNGKVEEGKCSEYLVSGDNLINVILTNRNWMIQGCHHSIKEGSYVTTLKVFLATPGLDIEGGRDGKWVGGDNAIKAIGSRLSSDFDLIKRSIEGVDNCFTNEPKQGIR